MADRTAILEAALRSARCWMDHWEADRQCNLAPTESSLRNASAEISRVLTGGELSATGRAFLATPAESVPPLSRYALAAE